MATWYSDPATCRLLVTLAVCLGLLIFAITATVSTWQQIEKGDVDLKWKETSCTVQNATVLAPCNCTTASTESDDCMDEPWELIVFVQIDILQGDSGDLLQQVHEAFVDDGRVRCYPKDKAVSLKDAFMKVKDRRCWYNKEISNQSDVEVLLSLRSSLQTSSRRIRAIWVSILTAVVGVVFLFLSYITFVNVRRSRLENRVVPSLQNESGSGPTTTDQSPPLMQ